MKRTVTSIALAVVVLAIVPGCLWLAGGTTALVLSVEGDSKSTPNGPPPKPIPDAAFFEGTFVPLKGTPTDVLIGDFVADPEGRADVVVTFTDRQWVAVFEGDGAGNLSRRSNVHLSGDAANALAIAAYPAGDGCEDLLVATGTRLERIPCGAGSRTVIELVLERTFRDIAVGDFDGDGAPDVAVSAGEDSVIEIFFGVPGDPGALEKRGTIQVESPRALASNNFDADPLGRFDLVVLSVEEGEPTLLLFVSEGRGAFTLADSIGVSDAQVNSGAGLDTRPDTLFPGDTGEDPDEYPDFVVNRRQSVTKILVYEDEDGVVRMHRHRRSTGGGGRRPVDGDLIHLPRESDPPFVHWDVAAIDSAADVVHVTYADPKNGLEKGDSVVFPIPGRGEALDVGDLDRNGLEDIAAVSILPSSLTVLLANHPGEGVELTPLFHPHAVGIGEDFGLSRVDKIEFGFAGEGRTQPFLVTTQSDSLVFLFLDLATGLRLDGEPERHPGFGDTLDKLAVGQFDGIAGDDVFAINREGRFYLLASRPEGDRRFTRVGGDSGAFLELQSLPSFPDAFREKGVEAKQGAAADFDGNGVADVVVPIQSENEQDLLAVMMNPGLPGFTPEADVRFLLTGDDPRHVVVANVNGDPAPDLVVACEGNSAFGNRVHVLFGNPEQGGAFFEDEADPIPPLSLEGIEVNSAAGEKAEVEFVLTDNAVTGLDQQAQFILAANDEKVSVYFNRTEDPLDPKFVEPPCLVYDGADPELLFLGDVFLANGSSKDLIIIDEDKPDTDRITLMELTGELPEAEAGCVNPWTPSEGPFIEDNPDEAVAFEPADGEFYLAMNVKRRPRIFIFRRGNCPPSCFERSFIIDLEVPNRAGHPAGAALGVIDGADRVLAVVVEDGDRETGHAAIDFQLLPADATAPELHAMGSMESPFVRARLIYEPGDSDQPLSVDNPSMVAWGDCLGDPYPDLVVIDHDPGTDIVRTFVHLGIDPSSGDFPPIELDAELIQELPGPVICVETVRSASGRDRVLLTTAAEVMLLDPLSAAEPVVLFAPDAAIEDVASGWTAGRDRVAEALDLAVVAGGTLSMFSRRTGVETVLATGVDGLVACRDLDHDARDDVVLVEPGMSTFSLRVFLAGDLDSPRLTVIESSTDPVDLAFLDANADGDLDVAVGGRNGDVLVAFGDGDGDFPVVTENFAGPDIEAVLAVDLTGDGIEEILAVTRIPGLVVMSASPGSDVSESP